MKIETSMYLIHFYISNVVFAKKINAKTRLFSFSKTNQEEIFFKKALLA